MANFKTHKNTSIFVSSIIAIIFYFMDIIFFYELFYLIFIGSISGLLPDLDHSESIPNELLFNIIGSIVVLLLLIIFYDIFAWYTVFGILLLSYLFVNYVLRFIYNKIVVHRGMFHSIPTALIFSIVILNFFYNLFGLEFEKSLMIGVFVFIGYMTHLILDEIYSVDLYNAKIKKSFGTALKFFSMKYVFSSIIVYCLLLVSIYFLPDSEIIFTGFNNLYIKIVG